MHSPIQTADAIATLEQYRRMITLDEAGSASEIRSSARAC